MPAPTLVGRLDRPLTPTAHPIRPRVSVVIPAKNEARNIAWVLERIPAHVDEVILVDGLSEDATEEIARMVRPGVIVVHEKRPGKGAALRAGFNRARGDIIVMMDADCSMDPREIDHFVDLVSAGHLFVKGSRFLPNGGTDDITRLRLVGNWALMALVNGLYGSRFTDLCYGFCAFRRTVLDRIELSADGFEIEMQLIARTYLAGIPVLEAPSFEAKRKHGQSNLRTFRDGWRILGTLVRERVRRRNPLGEVSASGTAQN